MDALKLALKDDSSAVRNAAAWALDMIKHSHDHHVLNEALEDGNLRLRISVLEDFLTINPEWAKSEDAVVCVPWLQEALRETELLPRAAELLRRIEGEDTVAALLKSSLPDGNGAEDDSEPPRRQELVAVQEQPPEVSDPEEADGEETEEIARLLSVFGDDDWRVRVQAADQLVALGDAAVRPLTRVLRHEPLWGLRRAAVETLARIGGDAVIAPLRLALRDREERVRQAAEHALRTLSVPQ